MLPDRLFETFSFTFTLKPLLIGGKAMEYYGLRTGTDYDFLIPKQEFRRLRQHFPAHFFTNAFGDAGIRIGTYELYASQFGFIYFQLEQGSSDQHDYVVAHLEFLFFLKTLTLVYEPGNQRAQHDLVLLIQKLGIRLPLPESNPDANGSEMRNEG